MLTASPAGCLPCNQPDPAAGADVGTGPFQFLQVPPWELSGLWSLQLTWPPRPRPTGGRCREQVRYGRAVLQGEQLICLHAFDDVRVSVLTLAPMRQAVAVWSIHLRQRRSSTAWLAGYGKRPSTVPVTDGIEEEVTATRAGASAPGLDVAAFDSIQAFRESRMI